MTQPAPDTTLLTHAHETTNIGLCVAGSFLETVRRRNVMVTTATMIARPAGELHENRFGPAPVRCVIIELLPSAATRFRQATDVLDRAFTRQSEFASIAARRLDGELRWRDAVTPLVVESLVHELVSEAHRAEDRCAAGRAAPAWLRRAVEVLRDSEGPASPPRLSELAREVGVHPSHLARAFRLHYGCSVGAYARARRLEAAARLIRTTPLGLAQIASATGFTDQSHLSHAFHWRYGTTPAAFRRATRS
jgi:AraC family transcriptional regulator